MAKQKNKSKKQNKKSKNNKTLYNWFYKNNIYIRTILIAITSLFVMLKIISSDYSYMLMANQEDEPIVEKIIDPDEIERDRVSLEIVDEGVNIYNPGNRKGYRYGPSIIINDDGSMDAFFSSVGNNSTEWDYIRYRHFDGVNWSNEKIVLTPTPGSKDTYSTCDPGVIYFNGYYYLGYTSTNDSINKGYNNKIFVARSEKVDGPYQKWNGSGWGGSPEPIITYEGDNKYWGAGEVSFVIVNNKLYCYYSYDCDSGYITKLSIADISENWPATLEFVADCFSKEYGEDSCDVVYLDEYNKFLSFSIEDRMTSNSGICIRESSDGINFEYIDTLRSGVSQYAHNIGISKRSDGHISFADNLYVGYGYGDQTNTWGKWSLRIQGVKLINYFGIRIRHDKYGKPTYRELYE